MLNAQTNRQLPESIPNTSWELVVAFWEMEIGSWSYFRVGALSIRVGRGAAATPLFSVSQNEPRPSGVS